MCGRYTVRAPAKELLEQLGLKVAAPATEPRFNVAPTSEVPALTNALPGEVTLVRWGLVPFWSKDAKGGYRMINARAETLTTKPAFKRLLGRKRCLLFADGFYEWKKGKSPKDKQPFFIHRADGKPFAFAGLWDTWRSAPEATVLTSASIITTTPNPLMAQLHDRMPVILHPEDYAAWLSPEPGAPEAFAAYLKPLEDGALEAWPVDPAVGNVKHQGAALTDATGPVIR